MLRTIGMIMHCRSLVWQLKNGLVSIADFSIRTLGRWEDQASFRMSDSGSPQRSAKWNTFFCYAATSDHRGPDVTAPGNHRKTLANLP